MKQATRSKRSSLRSSGGALLAAGAVVALMMACGDSNPNAISSTQGPPVVSGTCTTPNDGCYCATPGEKVNCTRKLAGDLNALFCLSGTRACGPDNRWGACTDGTVTTKTIHLNDLATSPVGCNAGLSGSTLSVCVDGKHKGDICATNADCANGEKKCSGGTDSTSTCNDNSDCQVACTSFNGKCAGGAKANEGCDGDADCPASTCALSGGTPLCGAYAGICDSSGPEDGQECNSSADCGGGSCEPPKFGVCIGGSKNNKKCKTSKHCKGGGVCSNGVQGDASALPIDPCDPACTVYADTAIGVDAGPGFLLADGGLTTAGCGDGVLVPPEACDDHNQTNGDGCASNCTLEPGYYCPTPGSPCLPSTCGNGIVEGLEQCDDTAPAATDRPYDGCFKCQFEVQCPPGGSCTPKCGDGVVMGTEQCDDGNVQSLDGCSSTCQIESGASCTNSTSALTPYIDVPVIYRDFAASAQVGAPYHPDFQATGGVPHAGIAGYGGYPCVSAGTTTKTHQGIMQALLAGDGKPTATSPVAVNYNECSVTSVNEWYRDVPAVNKTILGHYLRLFQSGGPTSTTYVFNSTTDAVTTNKINCGYGTATTCASQGGFWPINTEGFGAYSGGKNFHFTSEVHIPFTYKGGEILSFTGDDDVFVYVSGYKVVDLGGIHGAVGGSTTLANSMNTVPAGTTFTLTANETYDISVFQAERNTTGSNYKLTLEGFTRTISTCTKPPIPQTFVRDFQAVCGPGTHAEWTVFQWKADATATKTIDFRAATAPDQASLPADKADATTVAIGTANESAPTSWRYNGYPSVTPTTVQSQLKAAGQSSQNWLRVYMTFTSSPTLYEWQALYSCKDAE